MQGSRIVIWGGREERKQHKSEADDEGEMRGEGWETSARGRCSRFRATFDGERQPVNRLVILGWAGEAGFVKIY